MKPRRPSAPDARAARPDEVILLVNPDAGYNVPSRSASNRLKEVLDGLAEPIPVRYIPGASLASAAQRELDHGASRIIVAGGDGSVNAVASAMVGSQATLGVIPLGTLNHFAKDLAIPLDLSQALEVSRTAAPRSVDVGVLETPHTRLHFLNNAALGLYPRIVEERDRRMEQMGHAKWPTMASVLLDQFRRDRDLTLHLELVDRALLARTPFVFVGNNPYRVDLRWLGTRDRLDTGRLGVYYSSLSGRRAMMRLAWRTLTSRLGEAPGLEAHETERVRIDTLRREVRVALDGEVQRLPTPLSFSSLPGALQVATPQGAAA